MIDPNAEAIGHRPPYRRIDLACRRRKPIISEQDVANGEIPDEELYEYDWGHQHWILKG